MSFLKAARYALGGLLASQSVVHSDRPLYIGLLWFAFAVLVFGVSFWEARRTRVCCDVNGCHEKADHATLVTTASATGEQRFLVRLCDKHELRKHHLFRAFQESFEDHTVH